MNQLPTFIRLENTLNQALKYYNSPQMTEYSFEGVHLLPDNTYPYTQRTYAFDGIEIEDAIVRVKDLCGNTLADITDSFNVVRNFNDPATGLPQIEWSLTNVDFDAGYQLIYLEIQSGADGFIYSSPFMLTHSREEYTSHWFYRNKPNDTMLSIGFRVYYRQKKSLHEVSNYNPVSTGVPYTSASRLIRYERWNTDVIENGLLETFKDIFICNERYSHPKNFDGFPVLTGPYEAIESADLEADENFVEQEINLNRNYSITYDPLAVQVIPPAPTPEDPFITLLSVTRNNFFNVTMTFEVGNFAPTYLTLQYSLDGVTWVSNTGNPTSPRTTATGNNVLNNYYYRVIHQGTGTISNVLQLGIPSLSIDSVVSAGGARQYFVGYSKNFDIAPGTFIEFQSSNDGTNWSKVRAAYDNNNPKLIEVVEAIPAMDRVRMKYESIISNTVMLP